MDLASVGGALMAAAGFVGAAIAVKRLPQQQKVDTVNMSHSLLQDMKLYNDVVSAECERLRIRERELVVQITAAGTRSAGLERELEECRARRALLEDEVRRRGIEGVG